jgi:hypothetical protein
MEKEPQIEQEQIDPVDPALVERIEKLDLDAGHKMDLLMVLAGRKPAVYIHFNVSMWHDLDQQGHIFKSEDQVQEIIDTVQDSGLQNIVYPREDDIQQITLTDGREATLHSNVVKIIAAKDTASLENLDKAFKIEDGGLSVGVALGFPETASQAFAGNIEKKDLIQIPKETLLSEDFLFSPAVTLSKDHWQEEIKAGGTRARVVGQLSPQIYQEAWQRGLDSLDQLGLVVAE